MTNSQRHFFLVLPSPQKGAGWGRAQQQQQKINSCRSCNSSAPRAKRNKYRNDAE
jgi:hypothetical protein